jgi:hypothetical protein
LDDDDNDDDDNDYNDNNDDDNDNNDNGDGFTIYRVQRRMVRGGHILPVVIMGSAMPGPSTLCGGPPLGWAETAHSVSGR